MSTATARPQTAYLTEQLDDLKKKGTYFKLRVLEDEQEPVCTFDGKRVINLASNNYLGLTTHPKLREAALAATKKYGVGSGAVRTIAGTMRIHVELEEKLRASRMSRPAWCSSRDSRRTRERFRRCWEKKISLFPTS